MPQIRQYESRESAQAPIGGGRRANGSDFYQATGSEGAGLQQAGAAISGLGDALAKQEEDQEISAVRRSVAETQTSLTEQWINAQQTAQPGDLTIADKFSDNVKTQFAKLGEGLKTKAAQDYLAQAGDQLYGHFRANALQFQAAQAGKKAVLDFRGTRDANANTIAMDPSQYFSIRDRDAASLDRGDGPLGRIDPLTRQELKDETKHTYARAAATSLAENRPMDLLRAVKPSAVTNQNGVPTGGTVAGSGFDSAIKFVLDHEGGYVAKDGNSGAPANFGINQKYHPNIDVSKLTKQEAIDIHRKESWEASGANNLPPALALVTFDTAVNMGVGRAKLLLKQSGGDPGQMLSLREELYKSIAANDPEQSKNLKGWLSRVDDLKKQLPSLEQPSLADELAQSGKAEKTNIPGFDDLPFDEKISVLRTAETRANQMFSTGRAEMSKRLVDIQAEAETTGKVTNAPSKGELVYLYGPDEGVRIHGEVQKSIQLGQDLKSVWGMSPADQNSLLNSRAPVGGQAGYAEDLSRQNALSKAIDVARRQRDADPAQYAYVAVPEVKSAMDALMQAKDPVAKASAAKRYVALTEAEQRRLGVVDPTILPKNMADSIVHSFYDQTQGGQNATLLVRDLQQTWGSDFQKIFSQVADKLPASALVIPGMDDSPATLLAEASKLKKDELWGGLPDGSKNSIDDTLVSLMTPFQHSTLSSPSGAKSYDVYRDQAATLAAMYVRGGESPTSAAKRAYKEVLGKNYNFVGTYRVPVTETKDGVTTAIDASRVQLGARIALSQAAQLPVKVARSTTPGTTVEADRKSMVSSIAHNGHWVTSKGDSGLTLYYGDSAVVDTTGNPIFFTWSELQKRADVGDRVGPHGGRITTFDPWAFK